MINLGVKGRAFLLAFSPMLLITTVLTTFFLSHQSRDFDERINDRGESFSRHIANASEFDIFSGSHENLTILLQSFVGKDDITSITITDETGNLLVRVPEQASRDNETDGFEISRYREFRQPVILRTTPSVDINEPYNSDEISKSQEILGWVIAEISTAGLIKHQNSITKDALAIIITGLIASILLALWISRGLTLPISRLTQSVRRIEDGDIDITIDRTSTGEIGALEKGVESMLNKIRITQHDLQNRIDETTSGLMNSLGLLEEQNKELLAARKDALHASEAKSRFLANMSHEIRTPMNGILGFVRLLKNTDPTNEQNDYLNTIDKSANNLLILIDEILDISKVESGKINITDVLFNLEKCVEDVIILLTPAANDKGIVITSFHYLDTPKEIYAPYDRIRQILINFLGNAIKFSEDGSIVIRTMLSPNDENGDAVLISVTDQGIGIPENEKDSLFSPFTQVDDTSTKQYGGTGLGLAISKSLAEAMGGEVGVESAAGKGSSFWFSFLYKTDIPDKISTSDIQTHDDAKAMPYSSKNELDGLSILIAEDNEINTKLLKTILGNEGVKTYHAADGIQAIDIYSKNTIDLILMDIHMPKMSGIDAAREIRSIEKHDEHIPIIGITANAIKEDIIRFESAGIDIVLLKPIAIDELLAEIKRLIRNSRLKILSHHNYDENIKYKDSPDNAQKDDFSRLGINSDLASSLRKMLIDELPLIKMELNSEFSLKNWGALKENIHKLIGGTAYCDVPDLRNTALNFQESLKNQTKDLNDKFKLLLSEIDNLLLS